MEVPEVKISPSTPPSPRDALPSTYQPQEFWPSADAEDSAAAAAAAAVLLSSSPASASSYFMHNVLSTMLQEQEAAAAAAAATTASANTHQTSQPQPPPLSTPRNEESGLDVDLDQMHSAYERSFEGRLRVEQGDDGRRYSSLSDRIVAAAFGESAALASAADKAGASTTMGSLSVKNTFLTAGSARRARTESCDAVLEPSTSSSPGGAGALNFPPYNTLLSEFGSTAMSPSPLSSPNHHQQQNNSHHPHNTHQHNLPNITRDLMLPPLQTRSRYESCDSSHLFEIHGTPLPEVQGLAGYRPLEEPCLSRILSSPGGGAHYSTLNDAASSTASPPPQQQPPTYDAWRRGGAAWQDELVRGMFIQQQQQQQGFVPEFPILRSPPPPSTVTTDAAANAAAAAAWATLTPVVDQSQTPASEPAAEEAGAAVEDQAVEKVVEGGLASSVLPTPQTPPPAASRPSRRQQQQVAPSKAAATTEKKKRRGNRGNQQQNGAGGLATPAVTTALVATEEGSSSVPEGSPVRPEDLTRQVPSGMTTIMLRNIPNKYTQKMLLDVINEKFRGLYDFFYLPIDFRNKCNVGYAFINFLHSNYATMFKKEFDGLKLSAFKSNKVCEVSWGRVQGLAANIEHYRNSAVMSIPVAHFKPLLFKNGVPIPFPVADGPLPSVKLRPQKC